MEAFLKETSDCAGLWTVHTIRKPERFRNMINRKYPVCQAKDTRPARTGICEQLDNNNKFELEAAATKDDGTSALGILRNPPPSS